MAPIVESAEFKRALSNQVASGGFYMIGSPGTQIGTQALLFLVVNLFFIVVTWWGLQSFRFDTFFKNPNSLQAKIMMLLLTITIGSVVGNFFFNYLFQSLRLTYLF